MASHRYPRPGPSQERHYSDYQTAESASHQRWRYSRYTDSEDPHTPRRRRWAAGYIDSRSCPSYDYIGRRPKASGDEDGSDVEYIQPRGERNDDAIKSQWHYGASVTQPSTRYRGERSPPQQPVRSSESDPEEQSSSDIAIDEPYNRSPSYRVHAPQRPTPSSDPDTGGSDVLTTASQELGSDVVSIRSGRSSTSQVSRRSGRAASEASYVKLSRRERGGSDSSSGSDDDGDYISLDEYIAGRSDCDSGRVVSGDEDGEGSDAVGSDVAARSNVGEGSDVASVEGCGGYDSEDDCIEDDCIEDDCIEEYRVDYYGSDARR